MSSSIKSHEEHQLLVTAAVSALHSEFDKIFKVIVEDRTYDSKKENQVFQSVDLPHVRSLFNALFDSLTILQREHSGPDSGNKSKKMSKALSVYPCGIVDLEPVASVALRVLRINSSTSPKQVRADKKAFDDLIKLSLGDLHALAWKLIDFIFKNFQAGTFKFEVELGSLARDLIKIDLKSGGVLSKGSEVALEVFIHLQCNSSFSGKIFAAELAQSGIFVELSSKASKVFGALLRSGLAPYEQDQQISGNAGKRGRFHQASESDQKRHEDAQSKFTNDLNLAFKTLQQSFSVFSMAQVILSPSDHVVISENLLGALVSLLQAQHNYKFVPEIRDGEFLRILVEALSNSISSFLPSYLPPFLPVSLRLLSVISPSENSAGWAARRALMQADLLIHPRRLGPISFRPSSDNIQKVFQVPEVIPEISNEVQKIPAVEPVVDIKHTEKPTFDLDTHSNGKPADELVVDAKNMENSAGETKRIEKSANKPIVTSDVNPSSETSVNSVPILSEAVPSKRNFIDSSDDDDEPLPQIIDCDPDEL